MVFERSKRYYETCGDKGCKVDMDNLSIKIQKKGVSGQVDILKIILWVNKGAFKY